MVIYGMPNSTTKPPQTCCTCAKTYHSIKAIDRGFVCPECGSRHTYFFKHEGVIKCQKCKVTSKIGTIVRYAYDCTCGHKGSVGVIVKMMLSYGW